MIIDALTLLIGGRGSAELIRHGEAKAEIEAMFDLVVTIPSGRRWRSSGSKATVASRLSSAGKSPHRQKHKPH